MQTVRSIPEMQTLAAKLRAEGKTIALVPTMGCLHEGHLLLTELARTKASVVVVSIFVNPIQFGANEDYSRYPRTESADIAACSSRGVDIVFLPEAEAMFPAHFSTHVHEELCSHGLCGDFRPGHFRGVATVVAMLLNIVRPDVAVFGQKDAQQAAVLRKMSADLFLPVHIEIAPIVREPDGLAMSSRNRYLTVLQRKRAPELFAALKAGRAAAASGTRRALIVREAVSAHLSRFPDFRVQYIGVVDSVTMQPVDVVETGKTLLAAAVLLGTTRLIDNVLL
ncbi:MAG: pantoate--beta-alanine ligase [Puniceicoccales bacterium]|jgi:pantoate--beta-alanine ligase|nr:pantoate--beta-alanine ligase [Puniceicoccales bacterium]